MDVNPSKSSFLECNLLRKRTILLLLYCSHYRILHSNNQICEIVNLCINVIVFTSLYICLFCCSYVSNHSNLILESYETYNINL